MQGKITAANVLSDLYAMGVTKCDSVLMLLGICRTMPAELREIVTRELMRGFKEAVEVEAESRITGGQTVWNPWYLIGGVASSVVRKDVIIDGVRGKIGDVLVLTKPLGCQVVSNIHQWLRKDEKFSRIQSIISREEVERVYQAAMKQMARLNRNASLLMHKHNAHGATDVTGFGILGHAQNLLDIQLDKACMDFVIDRLPVYEKMDKIDAIVNFKLSEGYSAETSGGLLVMISHEDAANYCRELEELDGFESWIIGRIVEGTGKASISQPVHFNHFYY